MSKAKSCLSPRDSSLRMSTKFWFLLDIKQKEIQQNKKFFFFLKSKKRPEHIHIWRMHLRTLSLPDVRWQLTNPKDVPLKWKETPTAPLLPETIDAVNLNLQVNETSCSINNHAQISGGLGFLNAEFALCALVMVRSCRAAYPMCSPSQSSRWLCSHGWCDSHAQALQTQPALYSRGTALPPTGQYPTL